MDTEDFEELKVSEILLNSLVQFDESLRTGKTPDTLTLATDAEFLENLDIGRAVLAELEAAIPRRANVMPSWAPKSIGRFEIRSILGSGGFAVVYLAFDPRLGRTVALKIPRPHALVHPDLRRLFLREAIAAAKLDHPNIVPVFEAGEDCDVPYIACACCEGPTLASWFAARTTPIKPSLAAKIVRQLASAVQFSHEHGVLHRDIKPGNVLLFPTACSTEDAFPYTVRLGDFGLAKLMESDHSDTVTSLLIGTPSYMAPEIVGGKGQSGDVTRDVYALGAVLYYLIVGQAPFSAATVAESLRLIVDCDAVSPEVVNPAVGRDLSLICMMCLQKQPQHRYLSAEELGADLDRFLAGEPVKARRTPMVFRIQKWCRRYPSVATLIAVSAALVAILLVLGAQYTASLQDLQRQLKNSNNQLKQRVVELDSAIETATLHEAESEKNRRIAEEEVLAADLFTADALRRAGDIRGATQILDKYASSVSIRGRIDGRQSFPWRYLKAQTSMSGIVLPETGQVVWDMKMSPDGSRIALCGDKGRIRILDPHRDCQTVLEQQIANTELNSVAWCAPESILAVSGDDGIVRICDSTSLNVLQNLQAITGGKAFGIAFLPGTTHLLVSGESRELGLWDAASGKLLKSIVTPHDRMIECIDVSHDGQYIATGGDDSRMCMYRSEDLSLLWEYNKIQRDHDTVFNLVRFTPDGQYLVATAEKKSLFLHDSKTGDLIHRWTGLDKILALAVDANRIICGDERGLLSQFNIRQNQQQWIPESQWLGHDAKISSIVFVPTVSQSGTGSAFLSTARNQKFSLWQGVSQSRQQEFAGPASKVMSASPAISWHNNDTLLRCSDSRVDSLDTTTHEVRKMQAASSVVTCCEFAADAECLVIGDAQGAVTVVPDGEEPQPSIPVFDDAFIGNLSVDAAATRAVVKGSNREVAVIDLKNRRVLSRISDREESAVSPNGRWVISGRRATDTFEIFDAITMTHLQDLPDLDPTYVCIEFSLDSRFLLTASYDRMISVWSTATWTIVNQFSSKSVGIVALTVHPDETTFATADDEGNVKLWDAQSGRELVEIGKYTGPFLGLKFSPNGESLAICYKDLAVEVIHAPKR